MLDMDQLSQEAVQVFGVRTKFELGNWRFTLVQILSGLANS